MERWSGMVEWWNGGMEQWNSGMAEWQIVECGGGGHCTCAIGAAIVFVQVGVTAGQSCSTCSSWIVQSSVGQTNSICFSCTVQSVTTL